MTSKKIIAPNLRCLWFVLRFIVFFLFVHFDTLLFMRIRISTVWTIAKQMTTNRCFSRSQLTLNTLLLRNSQRTQHDIHVFASATTASFNKRIAEKVIFCCYMSRYVTWRNTINYNRVCVSNRVYFFWYLLSMWRMYFRGTPSLTIDAE